jgi:hypothetical protein
MNINLREYIKIVEKMWDDSEHNLFTGYGMEYQNRNNGRHSYSSSTGNVPNQEVVGKIASLGYKKSASPPGTRFGKTQTTYDHPTRGSITMSSDKDDNLHTVVHQHPNAS